MLRSTKAVEDRIKEIDKRVEQLEAQKQDLRSRARKKDRDEAYRQRTRRLIIVGGIMDRLGIDSVEKGQALQALANNAEALTFREALDLAAAGGRTVRTGIYR